MQSRYPVDMAFLRWVVLLSLAAGCGPAVEEKGDSDWMLGTFSDSFTGGHVLSVDHVEHYEFREDGTLTVTQLVGCASNVVDSVLEYEWRRDGDSKVIVDVPDPEGEFFQRWVVSPGFDCHSLRVNKIQVDAIQYGVDEERRLSRGTLCMMELPPCGSPECATCGATRCDEPPPACEE